MNRREARRAKRRARREARDECVDVLMAAVGYSCLTYVYLVAQISQIYYCKVRLGRLMAAVFCVLLAVPLVGVSVYYWRKLRREIKRIMSENQD